MRKIINVVKETIDSLKVISNIPVTKDLTVHITRREIVRHHREYKINQL